MEILHTVNLPSSLSQSQIATCPLRTEMAQEKEVEAPEKNRCLSMCEVNS